MNYHISSKFTISSHKMQGNLENTDHLGDQSFEAGWIDSRFAANKLIRPQGTRTILYHRHDTDPSYLRPTHGLLLSSDQRILDVRFSGHSTNSTNPQPSYDNNRVSPIGDDSHSDDSIHEIPGSLSGPKQSGKKKMENKEPKKRGRPRLLASGRMATERRREQIRLAQREYQRRKDSKISWMSDRITTLQSSINEMTKCMYSFSDQVLNSSVSVLHPDFTRTLLNTIQTFDTLAESAKDEGSGCPV